MDEDKADMKFVVNVRRKVVEAVQEMGRLTKARLHYPSSTLANEGEASIINPDFFLIL